MRLILTMVALLLSGAARAETLRIARQPGLSYLPLIIMQDHGLLEREAKARGIDLTVQWVTFTGGPPINDALLSGKIDLAAGGVGPMLTLWSRTRNSLKVKGLAALGNMPMWLMSSRPGVRSVADFTDHDRIALPGVKVSEQAVVLQMAALEAFGPGQQFRLDPLTVSMGHPDGEVALLSGESQVTAHFASAPFMYEEAANPRVHRVLNSTDVLGGAHTFNLVWTTTGWHDAHPAIVGVFIAALELAMVMIREDPAEAAAAWMRVEKYNMTADQVAGLVRRPENEWTTTPTRMMLFARFMHQTGAISDAPGDWRDLFFPGAAALNGS